MPTAHSKGSAQLRLKQMPGMPEQRNGNKQDGVKIAGLLENQPWKHPRTRLPVYLNRDISLNRKPAQTYLNWNLQPKKIPKRYLSLKKKIILFRLDDILLINIKTLIRSYLNSSISY